MRRAKGSGQSNLGARHIFHVQGLPAHGPSRAASSIKNLIDMVSEVCLIH